MSSSIIMKLSCPGASHRADWYQPSGLSSLPPRNHPTGAFLSSVVHEIAWLIEQPATATAYRVTPVDNALHSADRACDLLSDRLLLSLHRRMDALVFSRRVPG